MEHNLKKYGWQEKWQKVWNSHNFTMDYIPARVIADFGNSIQVASDNGIHSADTSGRMTYNLEDSQLPKVGDWVAISLHNQVTTIHHVLERSSYLARRGAGQKYEEQIMATNIDLALVIQSMDDDLNINRLKRYLFQLGRSQIRTIIIINKIDKDIDWRTKVSAIKQAMPNQEIIAIQATDPQSLDKIRTKIPIGASAVVLGSSGVGKSTIINGLLGIEKQRTQEVRLDDSKGRHTTTHREMFVLPNGALLIDTPGIRELQLWGTLEEIKDIDSNISEIATHCRFSNCSHNDEPGCSIRQAISDGTLSKADFESFNKMKNEIEFLNSKLGPEGKRAHKQKQKNLHKMYKKISKEKQADKDLFF